MDKLTDLLEDAFGAGFDHGQRPMRSWHYTFQEFLSDFQEKIRDVMSDLHEQGKDRGSSLCSLCGLVYRDDPLHPGYADVHRCPASLSFSRRSEQDQLDREIVDRNM